jgi:hypothetical protein
MPSYSRIATGPTGNYSFGIPDFRGSWEDSSKPVVQVVNTPARYYAETIAALADGANLSIDMGQGWDLGVEDTAAFREYAKNVLALTA